MCNPRLTGERPSFCKDVNSQRSSFSCKSRPTKPIALELPLPRKPQTLGTKKYRKHPLDRRRYDDWGTWVSKSPQVCKEQNPLILIHFFTTRTISNKPRAAYPALSNLWISFFGSTPPHLLHRVRARKGRLQLAITAGHSIVVHLCESTEGPQRLRWRKAVSIVLCSCPHGFLTNMFFGKFVIFQPHNEHIPLLQQYCTPSPSLFTNHDWFVMIYAT